MTPRLTTARRDHGDRYWSATLEADAHGGRLTFTATGDSRRDVEAAVAACAAANGIDVPPVSLPPRPGRVEAAFAAIGRGEKAAARAGDTFAWLEVE